MNSAELKLDLFRRIDQLDNTELEKIYDSFVALLNAKSEKLYVTPPHVKIAIDNAFDAIDKGKTISHDEAMRITKSKYPSLFK